MSKTVVPRTCIASNKALSFVFDVSRELELENGVWSDEQVVLDGGRYFQGYLRLGEISYSSMVEYLFDLESR